MPDAASSNPEEIVEHWTDADFADNLAKSEKPVVVDFWATWCAPCQVMAPIFEELAEDLKASHTFVKVDVDQNPNISQQYSILAIPTLVVFQDSKIIAQHSGASTKAQLQKTLGLN